jgi:hypothetical protein
MTHTLGAVPPNTFMLPADAGADIWGHYVLALADQIEIANAEMVSAYDTMRDMLKEIGGDVALLQTVADPAGLGYATAWTKDLEQAFVDINFMGQAVVGWLREAAAGERTIFIEKDGWALELKDTDDFVIKIDPATHLPYRADVPPPGATNGEPGTVGALPALAALPVAAQVGIIVLGIGAAVVVVGGAMYLIWKVIEAVRSSIFAVTDVQQTKAVYECFDKHPNGAKECLEMQENNTRLIRALNENRPKPGDEKGPLGDTFAGLSDLAKTLLWVGFGGAVLYIGARTIPPLLDDWQAASSARRVAKAR